MMKGNDLILSIDGVKLAAAKSCGVDRNVDTIEVCSPVDGPAKKFVPSTTSWAISAGGLYANRAGAERLRKIWRAYQNGESTPIRVNVTTEGVGEEGEAILTSLHEDGNLNELVKFSIQLQGSGVMEKTGTPLTLALALEDAHVNIYGSKAVSYDEDDQVDYVEINASMPFVLNFIDVDRWILVPGVHDDWEQELADYDGHGAIFNARVGSGIDKGTSKQFSSGKYVLYACNYESRINVKLVEE